MKGVLLEAEKMHDLIRSTIAFVDDPQMLGCGTPERQQILQNFVATEAEDNVNKGNYI
jgi:hypothetical protein